MKTQRRILVVDDDPVIGKSFERVLENKGYAVINCHSGEEALDKLKNEEYDAVFTDLKMSGIDGIEVATQIKAKQPWMPVVIVTGYGTKDATDKASALGVMDFIQKPLTPEMIEDSAERAIQEKESFVEVVEQKQSRLKNIGLFLLAPFIGLLYALAMPLVGVAMLLAMGVKALLKNKKTAVVAKVVASPFIGLAFAIGAPIFGIGAIAWTGGKAWLKD